MTGGIGGIASDILNHSVKYIASAVSSVEPAHSRRVMALPFKHDTFGICIKIRVGFQNVINCSKDINQNNIIIIISIRITVSLCE